MQESTQRYIEQIISVQSTQDRPDDLQAALDIIIDIAEKANLTVERFSSNGKPSILAYAGKTRPKTFAVLLNGHVDVVPAKPEQYTPHIEGERLYGRGALDMKSAAIVMTEVVAQHAHTLSYPIGLQIVTDEEIGGHNGTRHQLFDKEVSADFMITGEYTKQYGICTEMRGICWATVTFTGTSAHAAYLWEGENAIAPASDYVQSLLAAVPVPESDEWRTTVNIGSISTANKARNTVPDECTIKLDIRYKPGDERFSSPDTVKTFLQSFSPQAQVDVEMLESANFTEADNPYVQALCQSVEAVQHQPAFLYKKHGGADVRYMTEQGKASVNFGLQGEDIHGDNEYVSIESIERFRDTLTHFLSTADFLKK